MNQTRNSTRVACDSTIHHPAATQKGKNEGPLFRINGLGNNDLGKIGVVVRDENEEP